MARKLSGLQQAMLRAVAEHGPCHARELAEYTGQSSDGAAATLQSLIRRGLVETGINQSGYAVTSEGRSEAAR
jgi:DNA-binding MarR family transcriptional regulator